MTIFASPGVLVGHPDFSDAQTFANRLAAHKIKWVAVQVHDGTTEINSDWLLAHNWPGIMRAAGIRFGIWGFLQGDPAGEAQLASNLIGKFDDAGHSVFYIADAEEAYTSWGGDIQRSAAFVSAFRKLRPTRVAALSSYGAASWDFSLSTVFDYTPWIHGISGVANSAFEFLPQAYYNDAAEYEPRHCVDQAIANGWAASAVHPTIGIYDGKLGHRTGDEYSYLLRDLPTTGWSIFNGENVTDADLENLARLLP